MRQASGQVTAFGNVVTFATAQVRALLGTLLGLAGAAGFGGLIASGLSSGDALAKMSARLGTTVEGLQVLRTAAGLAGVSASQLDMGLQRMTRRVAEAARGTGEAKAALLELGVSAQRLVNLRPEQQFAVLADALGRVSNQSDRVRLAFKLFDSEGVALVNVARMGSQGIDTLSTSMANLGLIVAGPQLAAIEQASNSLSVLGQAFTVAGQTLAATLAPHIQSFVVTALALGKEVLPIVVGAIQTTTDVLGALAPVVKIGAAVFLAYKGTLLALAALEAAGMFLAWARAIATVTIATRGAAAATGLLSAAMALLNVSTGGVLAVLGKLAALAIGAALAWFGLNAVTKDFSEIMADVKAEMAALDAEIANSANNSLPELQSQMSQVGEETKEATNAFAGMATQLIAQRIELQQGARAAFAYQISLKDMNVHQRNALQSLYDQNEALRAQKQAFDEARQSAERSAKAFEQLGQSRAAGFIQRSTSEIERLQADLAEISALFQAGFLDRAQFDKVRADTVKRLDEALKRDKEGTLADFAVSRPKFSFDGPQATTGAARLARDLATPQLRIEEKIEKNTRKAAELAKRLVDQGLGLAVT